MTNPYPGSNEPNPYPGQPVPPPPSYAPPPPSYAPPPPVTYGGTPVAAGYAPVGVVGGGSNGLALASMIVALVGICVGMGFAGIVAVILGHMALNKINQSGGMLGGRGQAMTGLIIGYIEIAISVIVIIAYVAILSQAPASTGQ